MAYKHAATAEIAAATWAAITTVGIKVPAVAGASLHARTHIRTAKYPGFQVSCLLLGCPGDLPLTIVQRTHDNCSASLCVWVCV